MKINEPISEILDLIGETLTFTDFTILGIPGFDSLRMIGGEHSPYSVHRQEFSFQIATADAQGYVLDKDTTFTCSDDIYIYTFKIDRPPISDLTGWSQLFVNFVSKAAI